MLRLSIRARLTVWYLLVTFAGVLLFGVLSYGVMRYALLEEKKTHLLGREQRLIRLINENPTASGSAELSQLLANYALVTHEGNMFELRRPDGSAFFPAPSPRAQEIAAFDATCADHVFRRQRWKAEPTLVLCHQINLRGQALILYQGGSLTEEYDILCIYRNALLFLLPGLLILSSLCGYFLSKSAMDPVDRMTKAAIGIGIGNLGERLPVPETKDEVQQLAEAWNKLLGRLEDSVKRLSQFSADVSHDIRTSITIMLATSQLALSRERGVEEYREDLTRIAAECQTAASLLDALLSLVQSSNFIHEVSLQRVDLCELTIRGCARVEDLAEAKGILLDWDVSDEPVFIDGNDLLVSRLLGILLDNAIKYTPAEGEIRAEVRVRNNEAQILVRDTGVGISQAARERIFERFYQADLRERKTQSGCGLGLSIARWIADAHRAHITLESSPDSGSTFTVHFPTAIHAGANGASVALAAASNA